jgi:transcriptional regulator with XRE-family HTH domain
LVPVSLKALKPQPFESEPQRIGEHVRARRLALGLTQKQAAERLGTTPESVLHWEKGHTEPPIESIPRIVSFLGFDPLVPAPGLPGRLLAKRRKEGWSIREAAKQLGVDEETWAGWEVRRQEPTGKHGDLIERFLSVTPE